MKPETNGFTLIEALIALLILTFGLLSAGQLIFVALGSASLARSKESASLVAQNQLEMLADLYRRNPDAPELTEGSHLGDPVQIAGGRTVLHRFSVAWQVSAIPDPRGTLRNARLVRVTVTPIRADGAVNSKASLNKVVDVASVICAETQ